MTNTRKLKDEEKYGLILYAQSVCLCRQRLRLYARIIVEQRITRGNFFRCRGSASLKTDDDLLCFDDSICNCISVLRAS
jgi:hypothetical protein